MPKVFWYYLVVAIGLALLIYTMIKKRNFADLLSFFLAIASFAYLCEVLVLFVFGSYQYKPGVFTDSVAENIFGHLLCNGFFWGGTAVFVAAFSLKSLWILLISIGYMLVEVFFLKIGAYEHHWWKLYITGAAAFVIFTVGKWWFSALQCKKNKFLRKFTFFMIAWGILQGSSVILSILDLQHFLLGFVENKYLDDILSSVPYHLCIAVIYSALTSISNKWYYLILPLIINILMDNLFVFFNILNFYNGWNLLYFTFIRIIGFILFILLDKHTLCVTQPKSEGAKV